ELRIPLGTAASQEEGKETDAFRVELRIFLEQGPQLVGGEVLGRLAHFQVGGLGELQKGVVGDGLIGIVQKAKVILQGLHAVRAGERLGSFQIIQQGGGFHLPADVRVEFV